MALLRWWKLDETSGTSIADQSANNDSGLFNGGDDLSLKTGAGPGNIILNSLTFNGIDDEISNINPTPAVFTLSVWVWPNVIPFPIVGRLSNSNRFIRVHDVNTVRVSCDSSGTQTGISFTVRDISTIGWNHIVITRDAGNNGRVWVNGSESTSGIQALGSASMSFLHIGRAFISGNTFFNGKMAWLKLYDSDESANIAALYDEGFGVSLPSSFKPFFLEEVNDE